MKGKESHEVMVSVRKSGSQSSINLTAGTDICSLNLEMILHGWDDSWGDGWDDEELPGTPFKPVTRSFSYKGLTTRPVTKEGWND
ncbi:hypothetical protein SAY86_022233 [Trapa natans]|uniref:Uncharacterized protein n=1 Tax=Trapa natans TaxID=22666 RepID=A0AAN7ME93_TRANT|nr:hypothetical protein SAY86_022233 [Trapa natans]